MEGENNAPQNTPPVDTKTMKMPEGIRNSHLGPVLGVLLLLLALVAVGLFVWGGQLMKDGALQKEWNIPNNEPETPRAEADKDILGTLSPSDELDAIETDLKATNLDILDTDMAAAEQELNAGLGE